MAAMRKSASTPAHHDHETHPEGPSRQSHHNVGEAGARKSEAHHGHPGEGGRKSGAEAGRKSASRKSVPPSSRASIAPPAEESLSEEKRTGDLSGQWGKIVFCRRHFHSMTPMRLIFQLCGRFPYSHQKEFDGVYAYDFHWYYPGSIYFLVTLFLMMVILVLGLVNITHITFNSTLLVTGYRDTNVYEEQRLYEEVLVKRYFIPLIFVYSSLLHGCISGVLILSRKYYMSHYLTFWSKAVHTLHMDVSRSALGFSVKVLLGYAVVITSICLFALFKLGPTAIGLPTVFGDLTLRLFLHEEGWLQTNSQLRNDVQIVGAVFLVYVFTASKSSVLLFIYNCKTLCSAFAYWNGRVYAAVLRGGEFAQTEEGRTTYQLLFKDHCILMDLLEGLDKVSSYTIESYFGCQVFSLFYELYFCIRVAKVGDNRALAAYPENKVNAYFVRPKDWAPGLVMMFVSISIMFSATKSAAAVSEEAMAGLEVIRRKTMLGRKTDDELHFTLSMFSSYTAYKKMEVMSGGYYYINKDFLIGIISSVFSYFIILYQFQPVMDLSISANEEMGLREKYGKFLAEIEGLVEDHYDTTPIVGDPWQDLRSLKTNNGTTNFTAP